MNVKQKNLKRTLADSEELPEITDEWVAGADLYNGNKLVRRGRPKLDNPRQLLSLRLPPQVIARWKSTGPGWQSRSATRHSSNRPGPAGCWQYRR